MSIFETLFVAFLGKLIIGGMVALAVVVVIGVSIVIWTTR